MANKLLRIANVCIKNWSQFPIQRSWPKKWLIRFRAGAMSNTQRWTQTFNRGIAQSGMSACMGCKRSLVRIQLTRKNKKGKVCQILIYKPFSFWFTLFQSIFFQRFFLCFFLKSVNFVKAVTDFKCQFFTIRKKISLINMVI